MIRTKTYKVGCRQPQISIGVAVTEDLASRVDDYIRYLREIDYPGIEVVVAYIKDEIWHECLAKNAAAKAATTDIIVLTGIDDHPSASLVERTRIELTERPDSIVLAMRLDGLPDYRAFPNPFALGDWLCMRKDRFLAIGGYNERMKPAAWTENELIARAIANGLDVIMLDERVFHSWHAVRVDDAIMQANSKWNYDWAISDSAGIARLYYPSTGILETRFCKSSISAMPQRGSVVNTTCHVPYSDSYWPDIMADKKKRLQQ